MQTFLSVADGGSFSEAARVMGSSAAMVSRRVASLEQHLGIRLFNRSTRRVELSDAGRAYYPKCCELLAQLDVVEADISGLGHVPKGRLRISVPMDFGQLYLQSPIREFLSRFPDIQMDVRFDDEHVDLIRDQIDLAIRISDLADSSLVARKLGEVCIGCYAAPDYLAQYGEPRHPDDLRRHELLNYTLTRTPGRWQFEESGRLIQIPARGQLSTNNSRVLARAASLGLGVIRNPEFLVQDYLDDGSLLEILHEYRSPPLDISIVYAHRRFRPATIGAFADFLVDHFRGHETWAVHPGPSQHLN